MLLEGKIMLGIFLIFLFFYFFSMAFNPITLEYDKSVQGEMLRKIDINHKVIFKCFLFFIYFCFNLFY